MNADVCNIDDRRDLAHRYHRLLRQKESKSYKYNTKKYKITQQYIQVKTILYHKIVISRYRSCEQDFLMCSPAGVSETINTYYQRNINPQLLVQTQLIYELVIIRDNLWYVSYHNFSKSGISDAIEFLCTN